MLLCNRLERRNFESKIGIVKNRLGIQVIAMTTEAAVLHLNGGVFRILCTAIQVMGEGIMQNFARYAPEHKQQQQQTGATLPYVNLV